MPEQPNMASGATPITLHDCWNKIGVRGDGSCPELIGYVHCRNCPIYAAAAVALLDRGLLPNYLTDWTSHFAQKQRIEQLDTQSVVIFRIGAEWLALPTHIQGSTQNCGRFTRCRTGAAGQCKAWRTCVGNYWSAFLSATCSVWRTRPNLARISHRWYGRRPYLVA